MLRLRLALTLLLAAGATLAASAPALAESPEARLAKAIEAKDVAGATSAITEIAAKDDEPSAKTILTACGKAAGVIDLEDAAADALASMKSDAAHKAIFHAFKENSIEPARYLALAAIARMGTPDALEALGGGISDKDPLISFGSIKELKKRAPKDAVAIFVEKLPSLEKEKKLAGARREVVSALHDLTGKDIDQAQDWKNWWDTNKDSFNPVGTGGGKGGGDVVSRLRENHPADFQTVERLRKDDIIVIKGRSDKCEEVLDALKLPHTKMTYEELANYKLEPRTVLVLNCNGGAEAPSEDLIKKIQKHVADGGYVFTSDWVLKAVVQRAWPDKLSYLKSTPKVPDTDVHIRPGRDAAQHAYLRDVFPTDPFKRANFTWKVHEQSHMMKVGPGVTVLVESGDLEEKLNSGGDKKDGGDPNDPPEPPKKRGRQRNPPPQPPSGGDGGGSGGGMSGPREPTGGAGTPVAVTWKITGAVHKRVETGPGSDKKDPVDASGAVLHVMSHFKDQKSEAGDGFALQQLLLNFIVEHQKINQELGR